MTSAAVKFPRMSAAEYLELERDATCKHEFVDGIVYMMAGASTLHNTIALDIRGLLRARLKRPCRTYALDVKVEIKTTTIERFFYPDVFVTCSELDSDSHVIRQPVLIVEVVSESTEEFDRGDKFATYQLLPSLQEYLLVQQDRVEVDIFRKRTGWQLERFTVGDEIELESIQQRLAVASFYQDDAPQA